MTVCVTLKGWMIFSFPIYAELNANGPIRWKRVAPGTLAIGEAANMTKNPVQSKPLSRLRLRKLGNSRRQLLHLVVCITSQAFQNREVIPI